MRQEQGNAISPLLTSARSSRRRASMALTRPTREKSEVVARSCSPMPSRSR